MLRDWVKFGVIVIFELVGDIQHKLKYNPHEFESRGWVENGKMVKMAQINKEYIVFVVVELNRDTYNVD